MKPQPTNKQVAASIVKRIAIDIGRLALQGNQAASSKLAARCKQAIKAGKGV